MEGDNPTDGAPVAPQAQPAPQGQTINPGFQLEDPVRDRTREQFEKLLESNKRLYEQNEQLRQEFQQMAGKQQPASQPTNKLSDDFFITDPKTGEQYVDIPKFSEKVRTLEEKAKKADDLEQRIQNYIKASEQKEVERQQLEALQVYPELDPGNKDSFDPKFLKQARAVVWDSTLNPHDYGNRPLTLKEAAAFVRGEAKPKEEPKKEDSNQQGIKEAASVHIESAPQNPTTYTDSQELNELRYKTRRGDDEALAKRLIHAPHILPKDAQLEQ